MTTISTRYVDNGGQSTKDVIHDTSSSSPLTSPSVVIDTAVHGTLAPLTQIASGTAVSVAVDDNINVNDTSTGTGTSSSNEDNPKDPNSLKRTWLNLLPLERLVNFTLELDEHLPLEVREKVWPQDLQAAVIEAAVATLAASQDNEKAVRALQDFREKGPSVAATVHSNDNNSNALVDAGKVEDEAMGDPMAHREPQTLSLGSTAVPTAHIPVVPAPATPTPTYPHPSQAAKTTASGSPATSTTPYHMAAATTSYTYTYPYGGYPYTHPGNSQPYAYSYGPASATSQDDEEDLPSYEEMLVLALQAHNDPNGTAPKQLFQWMAATYPLQANFRPSASQALQKAYKRGRFEKNKEGKYRLNAAWEGGNTTRRTTRRPQSYSKAVTNPSPSSHPPSNTQAFPPQHYTWQYGGKKLPPRPPPPSHSASSLSATPTPHIAPSLPPSLPNPSALSATTSIPHALEVPPGTGAGTEEELTEADAESARDCWEAAQSILQALNLTSGFPSSLAAATAANDDVREHDNTGVEELKGEVSQVGVGEEKMNGAGVGEEVGMSDGKQSLGGSGQGQAVMPYPPPVIASDIHLPFSSPLSLSSSSATTTSSTATVTTNNNHNSNTSAQPKPLMDSLVPPSATTHAHISSSSSPSIPSSIGNNGLVANEVASLGLGTSRAALQGTLALLAAQLADIATAASSATTTAGGGATAVVSSNNSEWPTLAEAAAAATRVLPLGL